MRVPLETVPAQVQLRLPDLPVVAAHRLGGRDAGVEQDPTVCHLLRARQAQAAQVLVRLLVHHEQTGLCLHGFDALHDLERRTATEQKPRELPAVAGADLRPVNSPTLSAASVWLQGALCCHFQPSVTEEKALGDPQDEMLVPCSLGDDGDGFSHPMPCNPRDSSAQGSCQTTLHHPLSSGAFTEAASLPPKHQKPWFCPSEGQHSLSHQANSPAHPHFLDLGCRSSPQTQGRVENQGAQGGTKHPRRLWWLSCLCRVLPTGGVSSYPPPGEDLREKQPHLRIHPRAVPGASSDKGNRSWEREMGPSLLGSSSRQC